MVGNFRGDLFPLISLEIHKIFNILPAHSQMLITLAYVCLLYHAIITIIIYEPKCELLAILRLYGITAAVYAFVEHPPL